MMQQIDLRQLALDGSKMLWRSSVFLLSALWASTSDAQQRKSCDIINLIAVLLWTQEQIKLIVKESINAL